MLYRDGVERTGEYFGGLAIGRRFVRVGVLLLSLLIGQQACVQLVAFLIEADKVHLLDAICRSQEFP